MICFTGYTIFNGVFVKLVMNSPCIAEIITSKSPKCVEFFHQQDVGPTLLAYTWESYVTLCVLHFPQLEPDVEEFTYENLTDIDHGPSVVKVAWSPKTSMLVHPVGIIFCTIGQDSNLHLFHVNNKMEVIKKSLGSHKSFINDCAFEAGHGAEVASVGDDKKCRIWNTESCEQVMCIPLSSAGRSVRWNPSDLGKLLVGEQNGTLRMYDVFRYQPIFSFSCLQPSSGLTACDWSVINPMKIGCVAGTKWYIWDVSKGSIPESSGIAHSSHAHKFRFSYFNTGVFATRGLPSNDVKVHCLQQKDQVPITMSAKIGDGVTWHNILPVLAVGGNRKITVYNTQFV